MYLQLSWLEQTAHNRPVVGSSPTRSIVTLFIVLFLSWRITQVRLKGTVLKTVRRVKPCKGSNPLSSFFILSRDGAVWQLVGLITRRSQVQILLPQLKTKNTGSVVQGLTCLPVTQEIAGSIPVGTAMRVQFSGKTTAFQAVVASSILVTRFFLIWGLQLSWLERTPDKREVDGSSPFRPIYFLGKYSSG